VMGFGISMNFELVEDYSFRNRKAFP